MRFQLPYERDAERTRHARPEAWGVAAEARPASPARLAGAVGNRAFASAVSAGRVGAGGLLQRYEAPAEVTSA